MEVKRPWEIFAATYAWPERDNFFVTSFSTREKAKTRAREMHAVECAKKLGPTIMSPIWVRGPCGKVLKLWQTDEGRESREESYD